MRAVMCRAWGEVGDLKVEDVPAPTPGPGEVLIEVRATAVNYADALMVAGRYQTKPPLPFSPGLETAGVVAACGAGVTRFAPGDRVMAVLPYGGLAEFAVAPEAETFAIPAGMGFDEAGAFPIAYISSHVAIRWQGRLEAGETLLVLGAAGGVGLTAVEIGKAMGARVIAGGQHGREARRGPRARRRRPDRLRDREADRAGDGADQRQGGGRVLRSGRRRSLRRRAVVARLGRAHPARGVRRWRAADPGQPVAGQASRRAGLVAPLLPLARARQAAPVGRGADALVRRGQAAAAGVPPAAALDARSRRSGS